MKKKAKYLENLYVYNARSNSYEINLSLSNYEEIYNAYDYSQYRKRDMDEYFLDYIYDETLGIPLKYGVKLNFHVKKEIYDEEKTKILKNAIKNNFMWRMETNLIKLKDLYKKCLLLLFAGVIFLLLTLMFTTSSDSRGAFFDIFVESLSIIWWVFLWDLIEILAFDLTRLLKKRRLLKRLVNSKVNFEAY